MGPLVRTHDLREHAVGVHTERLSRLPPHNVAVFPVQDTDTLRRDMADDLRRVRGEEELAPRKRVAERGHDHPLPAGVEVQVNLVDQHHAGAGERVRQRRVGDGEAPGEVADEGEQALLAVGELVEGELFGALGHHHPHGRGDAANPEVLEAVEEPGDRGADRAELVVLPVEVDPLLLVRLAELLVLDVLAEREPLENSLKLLSEPDMASSSAFNCSKTCLRRKRWGTCKTARLTE